MLFERFADTVREDDAVKKAVEAGQWDHVIDYVNREVFDKPEEYYTLDKLRKAAAVDRRLSLREILEKVFDLIPGFRSKDELLEDEFGKFVPTTHLETPNPSCQSKTISRHTPPTAGLGASSTGGNSGDWQQIRCFRYRTSAPCQRSTRTSSRIHQGLRLVEPIRSIENISC